jgi:membrane-anchored protein YejM (alkaline phosphatase superfamily)
VLASASTLALAFPYLVRGADWSGFLEGTVALSVWIAVSVCLSKLRPTRVQYSAIAIALVFVGCGIAYKALQATEILWSKPLGATDDEISLALEAYGEQDISFQLAHHILGNGRGEVCGDLCRILREYTNIRNAQASVEVQLVNNLTAVHDQRPNIFVFVIDSMRPDYLGAYNPRVNFTPNLDAFARDSVVVHQVYSQYAGTSLSEPAIWSGAMMLHAHYPQPFSRLNSLDRMLHTDGYRMVISVDEVLSALLPADDEVTKLDTELKLWNHLELGSTLRQARDALDAMSGTRQPVFFYTQPKNVHQFARNDVPSPTSQHWQGPEGMNGRISYEVNWVDKCLGEFFDYLKRRGMYDDSIIIVTSDHGDATGEFGRNSHSTSIWPEIMRVPLIIHLPPKMRVQLVYDDTRISTLTDIAPTLYYLLGHRPIVHNPLYGRPLFLETREELESYPPQDLLLASDVRAVYGILTADRRYFYTTYDSPAQSYLFDLTTDPNAEHNILTPALKQRYDEEIIEHLQRIGDYYRYKPGVGSMLASAQ